ncbi:hypothetical protein GCM10010234_11680 [Streptomyces hawaiiensis]
MFGAAALRLDVMGGPETPIGANQCPPCVFGWREMLAHAGLHRFQSRVRWDGFVLEVRFGSHRALPSRSTFDTRSGYRPS